MGCWGMVFWRVGRGGFVGWSWRVFCFIFSTFATVWRWIHSKVTGVLPDVTEGLLGICCHGDCLVADIEVASNVVGLNVGP